MGRLVWKLKEEVLILQLYPDFDITAISAYAKSKT
jgi:hypothetical protein